MEINPGEIVSIRHYSSQNPFKSIVQCTGTGSITLKFTREFSSLNCINGDPIVIGFEKSGDVYVASCSILELKAKEGIIIVKPDSVDVLSDRRVFERFPVSFYADIKMKNNKSKHPSIVKTMSLGGILICSKSDLDDNHELEIDIYMDNTTLSVGALIVRKSHSENAYEYGLKTIYRDYSSQNSIKLYLQILKQDVSDHLNSMKEE